MGETADAAAGRDGGIEIATSSQRIASLDLIRGLAVMGILSVNIVDFAQPFALYLNPVAFGPIDLGDWLVWIANFLVVDGKMRALFSMLFGASLLLVTDRAEAAGEEPWSVHWRRMAVLFVIGCLHNFLLWDGDILTLYAMTGLIVYFVREKPAHILAARGAVLLTINTVVFIGLALLMMRTDAAAHLANASADTIAEWNGNAQQFYPGPGAIAEEVAARSGSWMTFVSYQLAGWGKVLASNFAVLPETAGLMMVGMAAFRAGLLTGEWDDRRLIRFAAWSIPLGLAAHAALIALEFRSHFYFAYFLGGFQGAMTGFRTVQALGYAALLIVACRNMGWIAQRIAAVGRAAFSNYLGTSLICTAIFYGWGLGLYGQLDRSEAWIIVPFVWALMLLWSKPWLERFHYGPLEWVWRSLSRWELQPMRRLAAKGD